MATIITNNLNKNPDQAVKNIERVAMGSATLVVLAGLALMATLAAVYFSALPAAFLTIPTTLMLGGIVALLFINHLQQEAEKKRTQSVDSLTKDAFTLDVDVAEDVNRVYRVCDPYDE